MRASESPGGGAIEPLASWQGKRDTVRGSRAEGILSPPVGEREGEGESVRATHSVGEELALPAPPRPDHPLPSPLPSRERGDGSAFGESIRILEARDKDTEQPLFVGDMALPNMEDAK